MIRKSTKFENTAFAHAASNYMMFNIYFHNLSEVKTAHEWIKKHRHHPLDSRSDFPFHDQVLLVD